MSENNNGVAAGAAVLAEVLSSPSAVTNAQIVAAQAEIRAFRATETGGLLLQFANAHGRAWKADSMTASNKRLKALWDASNAAVDLLVASIKKLQADKAALLAAAQAVGVLPEGYCFCSSDRDALKSKHEPECRDLRAAIASATAPLDAPEEQVRPAGAPVPSNTKPE